MKIRFHNLWKDELSRQTFPSEFELTVFIFGKNITFYYLVLFNFGITLEV